MSSFKNKRRSMIFDTYKKASFIFLASILFASYLFCSITTTQWENYYELPLYSNYNSNNQNGIKVKIESSSNSYYSPGTSANFVQMSSNEIKNIFQIAPNEYDILGNLDFFADQSFLAYARTLHCYENFMLWLQKKINSDKNFRKQTANMPGFKYSFSSWGKTKSGFHDFVNQEANRITNERVEQLAKEKQLEENRLKEVLRQEELRLAEAKQLEIHANAQKQKGFEEWQEKQPRLCVANHEALESLKSSITLCHSNNQKIVVRCQQRAAAIKKTIADNGTCFDYSSQIQHPKFTDPYADVFNNCYGTALDKQLHRELCGTRTAMLQLQTRHANNDHVQTFALLVYQTTALAKKEKCVEKAFNLSDFSYDLVQIISGGINILASGTKAVTKGVARGIKTVLTPQHWIDMGIGILELGIFLAKENARLDAAITSGNPEFLLELSNTYKQHHQALAQNFQETLQQLKEMSWEELIEGGFRFGTIFILDGVIINATTLAASNAGRTLVSQTAKVLNSPVAKEFALEVAGVGKIALEEGADVASKTIKIVSKNPKIVQDEGSFTGAMKRVINAANERGKAFEDFLVEKLGGKGSFKAKSANSSREFDGAIGDVWYEAKSGKYWDMLLSSKYKLTKFKEDMLRGLNVTKAHNVTYELHSNTPIPPCIKDWLIEKGIKFTEWP